MDNKINNNGHHYVDLGLPSGTLWATMNVGASKPSDCGLYFQWGDTQGYTAEQVVIGEGQKKFAEDESDYKFGVYPNYSKHTTPGVTLELEDDAAHANMGGDWHMPSPTQIQELLDNTTNTWTTQDGVNGRLFTSKSDSSKSIFIPAAGDAADGSVRNSGGYGLVWSSMLGTDLVSYGQYLYFYSGFVGLDSLSRYNGLSVRGVIDQSNDNSKDKKNNMDKNEKLNLVEILKDAPKGTKLWSPVYGDITFLEVNENADYPIICEGGISFTKEGRRIRGFPNAECVIFPSKENRNWAAFEIPKEHKHFETFQKVLVKEFCEGEYRWVPELYGYYDALPHLHYLVGTSWTIDLEDKIIPYEGNEDKVGTIAE